MLVFVVVAAAQKPSRRSSHNTSALYICFASEDIIHTYISILYYMLPRI